MYMISIFTLARPRIICLGVSPRPQSFRSLMMYVSLILNKDVGASPYISGSGRTTLIKSGILPSHSEMSNLKIFNRSPQEGEGLSSGKVMFVVGSKCLALGDVRPFRKSYRPFVLCAGVHFVELEGAEVLQMLRRDLKYIGTNL